MARARGGWGGSHWPAHFRLPLRQDHVARRADLAHLPPRLSRAELALDLDRRAHRGVVAPLHVVGGLLPSALPRLLVEVVLLPGRGVEGLQ